MQIKTVALFGISDFGLGFLKKLLESKYKIAFVTSKSKPALHTNNIENELIKICKLNKIEYLGHVNANSSDIVEKCKKVDLCILGGYDKILKSKVLNASKYGFINTHLGVIPENRGCNPSMWAILNNLQQGATTYFVNEKIDEGKIVDIVRLEKGNLNSYEAYQMLSNKVIENIINCIEKIEKKEDLSAPVGFNRYHKKGMPNDGYVSWSWSLNFIKRFSDSLIFPPYKPMSTMYRGMTINLTCHNINVIDILNVENGTILSKKGTRIEVKASNGIAECELDKDIKIKIGDVFSYKSGYNHTIEENFSEDYIR